MRTANILKTILLILGIISLTACCTTNPHPRAAAVVPGTHAYYFDLDKSTVRPQYTASLREQGQYLANHPNLRADVVGNADARGSDNYNYNLAMHRADTIANQLEANGASKNQIRVVSKGKNAPVANGTSEAVHQENRRVDVIYG